MLSGRRGWSSGPMERGRRPRPREGVVGVGKDARVGEAGWESGWRERCENEGRREGGLDVGLEAGLE